MESLDVIDLPGGARTTLLGCDGGGSGDPVLVLLPAMGVAAGYYTPFVQALADGGVSACVLDAPGQGGSRPRISRSHDYGYRDLAEQWVPAALAAVRERHPQRPVIMLGHSLGGHVLLAHLGAGGAAGLAGAVLLGAGSPYWRAQGRRRLLVQTQLVAAVARVHGHWPGPRFGFGGHQPRTLIREWARYARTGVLAPAGSPVEGPLGDVDLPVLSIDLDGDTLAPPRSVEHLLAKLPAAQVQRWLFAKGPHDPGRPVDHFSFARSPEIIAPRIAAWSREVTGRPPWAQDPQPRS